MIRSFSVIVPVLNQEKVITRTLESIEASIQFFQSNYVAHTVESEVVIVDEGSTDGTLDCLNAFIQPRPHYKLIHHTRCLGAGAARNTAVKLAKGDILLFCDGDDLFFPSHIYLCFCILNAETNSTANSSISLTVADQIYNLNLPQHPIGILKTGVFLQDQVHPHWKSAIENSIPLNLCVRRECHEFVEGYPEATVYRQIGCEDIAYYIWLSKFFAVCKVPIETVEYIRYPGNRFDQQLQKFQTAPEAYQEQFSPQEQKQHTLRKKLEKEHLQYLLEKLSTIETTDSIFPLLNWSNLATTYLLQERYAEAITLFEWGTNREPAAATRIKDELAAAYNNLGTRLHQQGQHEQAAAYFQQVVKLAPNYAPAELAAMHFNAGNLLQQLGQFEQALPYFEQALQLHPEFAEAAAGLRSTTYKAQVATKGYQFTQDWFSHNIASWQQYLQPLAHQPNVQALEIGSWEGRSTCWLLDNILTDPSARITCIDTFEGGIDHTQHYTPTDFQAVESRFDENIIKAGASEKVKKMVGQSRQVLRLLTPNYYHLLYIDGSHVASDVLEDAVLAWALIRVGGIIIFDDYGFSFPSHISEYPPKIAIDAFFAVFASKIKVLHRAYQIIVEKIAE